MRFALKMILAVSVLLALSLSVGGTIVVGNAFRAEADTAVSEAQEDMKLFGTTLQALCLMEGGTEQPEQTVRRVLQSYPVFGSYSCRVCGEDGRTVFGDAPSQPWTQTARDPGVIETQLLQSGDWTLVRSAQRLTLLGQVFLLERSRDISAVVVRAERNLRQYELVMLAILLCGMLLTTLLTLWMTRPIRRVTRTAKQLSDGQYDRRAAVRSDDELGQLARDFNRMADALEEKIHALEDAAQRQKDFTASFAHELKTPLTSVIGYADTLRSRRLSPKQQLEAAGYILSEGKRLEAMSFALLDLFALERNAPQMRSVCAAQLVRELDGSVAYLLKEHGIQLDAQAQDAELFASPELLRTLLYNLIDNARKASAAGGVIELRGSRDGDGYCFTVTDHGRGIPQEALPRLTEPFYMVDKSRARAQGGAGLGLTLCRRIAQAHGGELSFESEEERGTVVRVRLGGTAQ